MRNFMFGILFTLVVLSLIACSAQNTLHASAQVPGQVRLADRYWVSDAPRFRLPASASLRVEGGDGTPEAWLLAANTGVQGVFGNTQGTLFSLRVAWPQVPPKDTTLTQKRIAAGLFGVIEMPDVPVQEHIDVWLQDAQGQTLAAMQLHISPKWWGPTWQNSDTLADGFRQLATVLQGS